MRIASAYLGRVNIAPDFVKNIQGLLGEVDCKNFLDGLNSNSPTSIRINPFKFRLKEQSTTIPWCSTGQYLNERPSFTLDPAFHAGGYYVQEASSMFLEQALLHTLDLRQPLRALDLCAAPGGKSTHLLSLLSTESLLVSNEVIRARAYVLTENITKWGCTNVIVTNNDPQKFAELPSYFDLLVVDAPCSGEGLFRKEPEAMQAWSMGNVELCSQRQRRILSDAWPTLKENGILIYSTCTYNRKENEENLKWLLQNQSIEFIRIPLNPEWGIEEVHAEGIVGYRFYPHRVKGEGFFISAIRKRSTEKTINFKAKQKSKALPQVERIQNWLHQAEGFHFFERPEGIRFTQKHYADDLEVLANQLYIIQAGTGLGTFKHDKFIPDHALALSNHLNRANVNCIPVTHEQALQYLRKENLLLDAPKGYSLLIYDDSALGWINGLGNRINNLYPVNWRIRMKA